MTIPKTINIIAVIAENGAIGHKNNLLYHLPNDLKHFRQLTIGKTIIMGRHTFESLPYGALPNRRNIVLSRTLKDDSLPRCEMYHNIEQALSHCSEKEEIFIIGGGETYKQTLPYATHLFLTSVKNSPTVVDTFFPNYSEWAEIKREEHAADDKHPFDYSFVEFIRRK